MNTVSYKVDFCGEKSSVECYQSKVVIHHAHPPLHIVSIKNPDKKELENMLEKVETCKRHMEKALMSSLASHVTVALKNQIKDDRLIMKIIAEKILRFQ